MNTERAIEIITNKVQDENMTMEQDMALEHIQALVEKHIPKKAIEIQNIFNENLFSYSCPVCFGNLIAGGNYCVMCGQFIDWGTDEREREREIEL